MRSHRYMVFLVTLGLCAFSSAAQEDDSPTLASIEEAVRTAWADIDAITAQLELETAILEMPTKGRGSASVQREENTTRYRQEIALTFPPPMDIEGRMKAIYDGEALYVINEMMNEAAAFRTQPTREAAPPAPVPGLLLDAMKERFTLAPAQGNAVEGREAWWLEGTRNSGEQREETVRLAFDKKTGFPLYVSRHTPDAPEPVVLTYHTIEVGAVPSGEAFTFDAPEDVRVKTLDAPEDVRPGAAEEDAADAPAPEEGADNSTEAAEPGPGSGGGEAAAPTEESQDEHQDTQEGDNGT
ncbi:MAG: LolA family protein [Candidatus Hydrogenedentota bacterium]